MDIINIIIIIKIIWIFLMESVTVTMTSTCFQLFGVYRTRDQVLCFECCNVSNIAQSITRFTKAFKGTRQVQ